MHMNGLRVCAAVLSSLTLCMAMAQQYDKTKPPSNKPLPIVTAKALAVEGNVTIEVKYTWEDEGFYWAATSECKNSCRGSTSHLLHAACDDSCDEPCKVIHQFTRLAQVGKNYTAYADLTAAFKKMGVPSGGEITITRELTDGAMDHLGTLSSYQLKYSERHFCKEHCSTMVHQLGGRQWQLFANWQLIRTEEKPDGTKARVLGPTGKDLVGGVMLPTEDIQVGYQKTLCRCSANSEENPSVKEHAGLTITEEGKFSVCDIKKEKDLKIEFYVDSMGECTMSAENPYDHEVTLCTWPGSELDLDDEADQDVVVCTPLKLILPAYMPPLRAGPIGALEPKRMTVKGLCACMNMSKKAPHGQRAKFRMPSSDALTKLANYYNNESFKGPANQVRMWIITDRSPLDEMRKHLIPAPNESTYLRSCYIDATTGGIDFLSPEYKELLEPRLIAGGPAPEAAIRWFVETYGSFDGKGLASWINENPDAFAPMFGDVADRYGIEYMANVVNVLCSSQDAGLQKAGLQLASKSVPEDMRAKFAKAGGLFGCGSLLVSGDAETAGLALQALAVYKAPNTKFYLLNASSALSEEGKVKAAALLKELSG